MRDVLVDYLRERQPSVDFSSLQRFAYAVDPASQFTRLVSADQYCAYTPRVDDATAGRAALPSRSALFWSLIVGVSYLIINAAVLVVEYLSEMSKLDRGFFTDTFSPYLYANILTFPTRARTTCGM